MLECILILAVFCVLPLVMMIVNYYTIETPEEFKSRVWRENFYRERRRYDAIVRVLRCDHCCRTASRLPAELEAKLCEKFRKKGWVVNYDARVEWYEKNPLASDKG